MGADVADVYQLAVDEEAYSSEGEPWGLQARAIYRANVFKSTRTPEEADREKVFADPGEFTEHHKKLPKLPKGPARRIGKPVPDAIEKALQAISDASEDLSSAEYEEFLGEMLAIAEGWKIRSLLRYL